MITLNNINLSSINLSGIDLRGIKLGLGGRGSSGDGFPVLPGDVTRWHFGGLTNEMMAAMDDPRIEDADGKGRFLSFKNFLWSGMSGVGGYNYNFTQKNIFNYVGPNVGAKVSSDTLFIEKVDRSRVNCTIKLSQFKCQLKVTGVTEAISNGEVQRLRIYSSKDTANSIYIEKDGIYDVDVLNPEDGVIYVFVNSPQTDMSDPLTLTSPIAIEQLPFYPGFILGDGVDDEAVTENNLDLEDTYTVYTPLILLKYGGVVCGKSSAKDYSLNTVTSSKSIGFDSANSWSGSIPVDLYKFVLVVCKRNSKTMYVKDLITGKSNQSNSKEFVSNPGKYFIWRNTGGSWSQVAIAGQVICNGYFSTDEDDEKVLNYYKQEYPWLFFDQAWTVTGKTNEDEDRATIANITGNGNNLVLSNLGFIEGSGYNEEGGYEGYLVTDGVDDIIRSSAFSVGKDFTVVGEWKMLKNSDTHELAGINKHDSFILYNYSYNNRINVYIHSGQGTPINTDSIKAFTSTGLIYINDFNNVEEVIPRDKTDLGYPLFIGYNNNVFTKLAFKNLAIYPTVLSKEDCIKAYNYLQTLKAK